MTIVIPDLHGELGLLEQVLAAYPGREYLFLGDLIDRGPDSPGVVSRVKELVMAGRAQLVRGNHEDLMIRGVKYQDFDQFNCWYQNGGKETTEQYEAGPPGLFTEHLDWIECHSYQWLSIDDPISGGKILCSHGCRPDQSLVYTFPSLRDPKHTLTRSDHHLWTSARVCSPALPDGYAYSVHGHVPQLRPRPAPRYFTGQTQPYWMLDIGSCFNGHLAVLDTLSGQTRSFTR